jgi:hypothetical protein
MGFFLEPESAAKGGGFFAIIDSFLTEKTTIDPSAETIGSSVWNFRQEFVSMGLLEKCYPA